MQQIRRTVPVLNLRCRYGKPRSIHIAWLAPPIDRASEMNLGEKPNPPRWTGLYWVTGLTVEAEFSDGELLWCGELKHTSSESEGLEDDVTIDANHDCDSRRLHKLPGGHLRVLFRLTFGIEFTWQCLVKALDGVGALSTITLTSFRNMKLTIAVLRQKAPDTKPGSAYG